MTRGYEGVPVIPDNTYRKTYGMAACVWAAFILYGSLLPFTLRDTPASIKWLWGGGQTAPFAYLGGLDWATNVVIGVLLAFLIMGTLARRGAGPVTTTLLFCLSISVAVEFTQIFFSGRVPSLGDVAAQVIGASIGIVLWRACGDPLSRLMADIASGGVGALRAAFLMLTVGYVGFALFPFDVILSIQGVIAHFKDPGTVSLWSRDADMGLRNVLVSFLKFAVLMPLGAFVASNPHRSARDGLFLAVAAGLFVSVCLFLVRILLLSSGADTLFSLLARAVGVPAGFLVWRWVQRTSFDGLLWLLRPAALVALPVYALLLFGVRGVFSGSRPGAEKIGLILDQLVWLPFHYEIAASSIRAVASVGAALAQYVPLGLLMALLLGKRRSPGIVVFAGLVLSGALQGAGLLLAGLRPDPTNLVLAIVGALFGAALVPWFSQSLRAHRDNIPWARSRLVSKK